LKSFTPGRAALFTFAVGIFSRRYGSFQRAGNLLIARDHHSATRLPNGTVLVAGGYSQGFDGDADPSVETMFTAELFNPGALDSTAAASLGEARAEHVTTLLNNAQVLVTGGVCRTEAPAYARTDFIIARDGRIAALYLFFDGLP